MNRWVWVFICLIAAGLLLLCGWLLPAHLRAVDVNVLHRAGSGSPALVDIGMSFVDKGRLGSAQLLLDASEQMKIESRERLPFNVNPLAEKHPAGGGWGGRDASLGIFFL